MRYLDFERPIEDLDRLIKEQEDYARKTGVDLASEIESLQRRRNQLVRDTFYHLTPYQRIQLARHPERPYCLDYVNLLTSDFIELHGDRKFGEDPAIVGGLANLDGTSVMIVGHQKGRNTEENLKRNFGMPNPEGFRKALRLMETAERFRKPIVCFIDSAGAYPGIGGEERGQAEAIAYNLMRMSRLRVPILVVVTGEGGSGGALAIGVGDRVLLLQNAYYAVCTPEACAAILFKDRGKAASAVSSMKITGEDLLRLGVIDEIIPEPVGGAHLNWRETADNLRESLLRNLHELKTLSGEELVEARYKRYRSIGEFEEVKDRPLQFRVKEAPPRETEKKVKNPFSMVSA